MIQALLLEKHLSDPARCRHGTASISGKSRHRRASGSVCSSSGQALGLLLPRSGCLDSIQNTVPVVGSLGLAALEFKSGFRHRREVPFLSLLTGTPKLDGGMPEIPELERLSQVPWPANQISELQVQRATLSQKNQRAGKMAQ